MLWVWVHRAAPRIPTTGSLWQTQTGVPGRPGMSASRRKSPRAVNPEAEAPWPPNSNSLLRPSENVLGHRDRGACQPASSDRARETSPPSLVGGTSPAPQHRGTRMPRLPNSCPASGSRRTTPARDAGHAHRHSPRSLNPAHLKFQSESAVRGLDVCGSCTNCTAHARRALRGAGSEQ